MKTTAPPALPAEARYRPMRRKNAPHPYDELLQDVTLIVIPRGIVRALIEQAHHADTRIQRENRVRYDPGQCVACDLEHLAKQHSIEAAS